MIRFNSILFFLIAVMSLTLVAQPKIQTAESQLKGLKKRLTLTDEQLPKVESILKAAEAKLKTLAEAGEPDKKQMKAIKENTTKEIEKLLDDKQKEEYAKMQEESRQRAAERKKAQK